MSAALEPSLGGHGELPRTLSEDVAGALKRWEARLGEH
jgi:hypothetical protein